MLTLFHAAKGGSGTTVVTALAGLTHRGPTLLIDLDGDLPAALGVADRTAPGAVDWMLSDAPLEHLNDLVADVDHTTTLLARRATSHHVDEPLAPTFRWMQLSSWSRSWSEQRNGHVFIDAGTRTLPDEFVAACDQRLLVTRPCYLALLAAAALPSTPTGVVVVTEPGRSLTSPDIELSTRAPVVATLAWDPLIARAVDAGLLHSRRRTRSVSRQLARIWRTADPTVAA